MKRIIFLVVGAVFLIAACAAPNDKPVTTTEYVLPFKPDDPVVSIYMKEEASFKTYSVAGGALIRFKLPETVVLLTGEYVPYARSIDGTYYKHKEKGVKISHGALWDHVPGGIKIPDDPSGDWNVWIWHYEQQSSGGTLRTRINRNSVKVFPAFEEDISGKIRYSDE